MKETKTSLSRMVSRATEEFARGLALIDELSDESFGAFSSGAGSIGAHFRHNLDFANCILEGLENGKVDYSARQRDPRVESERGFAKERILQTMTRLLDTGEGEDIDLKVRSEVETDLWHSSTLARELEFLHSHTVHHYALIGEKLKRLGIDVKSDFGVAPSTLKYWKERTVREKASRASG